jgi:hypothetical protein
MGLWNRSIFDGTRKIGICFSTLHEADPLSFAYQLASLVAGPETYMGSFDDSLTDEYIIVRLRYPETARLGFEAGVTWLRFFFSLERRGVFGFQYLVTTAGPCHTAELPGGASLAASAPVRPFSGPRVRKEAAELQKCRFSWTPHHKSSQSPDCKTASLGRSSIIFMDSISTLAAPTLQVAPIVGPSLLLRRLTYCGN